MFTNNKLCIALRLSLAEEICIDKEDIAKQVKGSNIGGTQVNKDIFVFNKDLFKRGVNSDNQRSVVIWSSFIPSSFLAELEQGIICMHSCLSFVQRTEAIL